MSSFINILKMTNYTKWGTDQWILGVNKRLVGKGEKCDYKKEKDEGSLQ